MLDTESRSLRPREAYDKTKQMLKGLSLNCFDFLIKKIDSTLRGNVAAEIKAVDEIFKSELIIFMPAFPELNRTTVNSIHYLKGVRITETELAHDPKKPVHEDNLIKLMEEFFDEPVTGISLEQIRRDEISFSEPVLFVVMYKPTKICGVVGCTLHKTCFMVGTAFSG